MIKKLDNYLDGLIDERGDIRVYADSLLNEIESFGMLPPTRPELKSLPEPYETYDIDGKSIPMIAKLIEVNTWIPENE